MTTEAIASRAIAFLEALGAGDRKHSGRTSLCHLVNTYRLAAEASAPREVQLAALMHNVYGTPVYGEALMPLAFRPTLASLIGDDAERLVFEFHRLPVARLGIHLASCAGAIRADDSVVVAQGKPRRRIVLGGDVALQLLAVDIANYVEQTRGRGPRKWVANLSHQRGLPDYVELLARREARLGR